MRFLFSVIADGTEQDAPGVMVAIDAFNDKLQEGGHRIVACGVGAPNTAITIDNRRGQAEVVTAPFVDAKEFLSGFWIIEASGPEQARELAIEASQCCDRKIEVRPLLG